MRSSAMPIWIAWLIVAPALGPEAAATFPLPLDQYADPAGGFIDVLTSRARQAPFNVVATLVFPDLALLFVGGDDFEAIANELWKFAIVGTLLSMIQLLVYSALARRQGRATILIWTAIVLLVIGALAVNSAASLVLVVVAVDSALFVALLVVALSSTRASVMVPAEARPTP